MERTLSPKEFVIAGLLNEGPAHGYELEQKIKNRGMRDWTQIGFSSIYHVLGKLKKNGYVTQIKKIVSGKLQNIYRLSNSGLEAFEKQVQFSISTIGRGASDFDVAISNTNDMPFVKVRGLIQQRIRNLGDTISRLAAMREEKLNSGMPDIPAATILFDRPIALLKAEKEFLEIYIDKF